MFGERGLRWVGLRSKIPKRNNKQNNNKNPDHNHETTKEHQILNGAQKKPEEGSDFIELNTL